MGGVLAETEATGASNDAPSSTPVTRRRIDVDFMVFPPCPATGTVPEIPYHFFRNDLLLVQTMSDTSGKVKS
jgi:hypothetical protein